MRHLIRRAAPGMPGITDTGRHTAVREEVIRSTTLKVEIWMICSAIFSAISSITAALATAADTAVLAETDTAAADSVEKVSAEVALEAAVLAEVASAETAFGGSSYRQKGSDISAEVTVGFDEAAFGCDKVIRLQNPSDPKNGVQSLQVHIPAGIDTGKSIRLKGKGAAGVNGGDPGDLLLKVTVAGKPGYERKGPDVYTTVRIPYTTAVFGGEAVVNTLYGNVICKIREGTQSGSKIRLRGKGIVSMKNPSVYGDQYVTVQIEVPTNLTPAAKQKLKEFEALCAGRARTA